MLRSNLVANFLGVGSVAIIQLVCVPFYIDFMGVEAYGLVGFYVTLLASLQILDLGISPAVNREIARYSARADSADEMRDLVRTLEIGYWGVGICLGIVVFAAAPTIATRWLNVRALQVEEVTQAVTIMGALIALQWPLSFYQGGLRGLQRQVRLNAIKILAAVLSGAGGVYVLWAVSPSITAFFAWQSVVAVIHIVLIVAALWMGLPRGERAPQFAFGLVKRMWKFAAGMSGIALFGMMLGQMDKIVVSKLLSLEAFGYYMVALTLANGLQLVFAPIFDAIFPRLSVLAAQGDEAAIRSLYRGSSQLMAVLIVPGAAVLALFSLEILTLWTGNEQISVAAAPILSLLVIGSAINGLMHLPYALQLASGWTSIGVRLAAAKVLVFLPSLVYMTREFGVIGAAAVWAVLNLAYLCVGVPLTHRRLLKGAAGEWLVRDVGCVVAAALVILVPARLLLTELTGRIEALLGVTMVAVLSVVAAVLVAPDVRARVLRLALAWGRSAA